MKKHHWWGITGFGGGFVGGILFMNFVWPTLQGLLPGSGSTNNGSSST
jgi:hypothetical protein